MKRISKVLINSCVFAAISFSAKADITKQVFFDDLPFEEAVRTGIIKPCYRQSLTQNQIKITHDQEPPYHYTLSSYQFSTKAINDLNAVMINTAESESAVRYSTLIATGGPIVSGYQGQHYDQLAQALLNDNTYMPGCRVPTIYGGWSVDLEANTYTQNSGVVASRGPIYISTNKATIKEALFRTPTGIRFRPGTGIADPIITEIAIVPRLYIYGQGDEMEQSWTTFLSGEIDFSTSLVNLTVHNAIVNIEFNRALLPQPPLN